MEKAHVMTSKCPSPQAIAKFLLQLKQQDTWVVCNTFRQRKIIDVHAKQWDENPKDPDRYVYGASHSNHQRGMGQPWSTYDLTSWGNFNMFQLSWTVCQDYKDTRDTRKDCGCLLVVLLHVAGLQGFDSGGLVILEQEAAYAKIMEGRVRMPSICTGFMLQRERPMWCWGISLFLSIAKRQSQATTGELTNAEGISPTEEPIGKWMLEWVCPAMGRAPKLSCDHGIWWYIESAVWCILDLGRPSFGQTQLVYQTHRNGWRNVQPWWATEVSLLGRCEVWSSPAGVVWEKVAKHAKANHFEYFWVHWGGHLH